MAGSKRRSEGDVARTLETYADAWERAARTRGSARATGAGRLREDAWQRFLSLGFPTTREEEWRFTSVAPIAEGAFRLAAPSAGVPLVADVDSLRISDAAAELVFVDGQYVPLLSRLPARTAGVHVDSLANALATHGDRVLQNLAQALPAGPQPFVALNLAFLDDGAWIELAARAVIERPIHLLFLASGEAEKGPLMAHPHIVVAAGESSQAAVVETYSGAAGVRYFTNAVTEIRLGENARLDHYVLQHEGPDAYHVGTIHVHARRSAAFASHAVNLGGALVRNDLSAVLDGEGAQCTFNGLYAADGDRLVDNHTTIDHARPHCDSREMYRGILADRARGVFNGKIIVRPDAQKTDAKQTNRALLLSEDARINTKPQLEIFANDVKCTHGAAVGQLDDEALFYLRSRGLSESFARRMLIHAFATDVLSRMPLAPIRAAVDARLQRQLARALAKAA